MKCPHCLVEFHADQTWWSVSLASDVEGWWLLTRRTCPACNRFVVYLENGQQPSPTPAFQGQQGSRLGVVSRMLLVWPKGVSRAPVPAEVPIPIAEDYKEACSFSPIALKRLPLLVAGACRMFFERRQGSSRPICTMRFNKSSTARRCRQLSPTALMQSESSEILLLIRSRAKA